jgi:hypothetical protein
MALTNAQVCAIYAKWKAYGLLKRDYVKCIQTKLNKCGYNLAVDGLVWSKTITATFEFQKANKITADGIAGPQTNAKLEEVLARIIPTYVTDWNKYKNFERSEFKCGCAGKYCNGYPTEMHTSLINVLQFDIRDYFGRPVTITSGARCQKYNASLAGSSAASLHLLGMAADFYVSGESISNVLARCAYLKKMGKIQYYYTNNTNMRGAVHINI